MGGYGDYDWSVCVQVPHQLDSKDFSILRDAEVKTREWVSGTVWGERGGESRSFWGKIKRHSCNTVNVMF